MDLRQQKLERTNHWSRRLMLNQPHHVSLLWVIVEILRHSITCMNPSLQLRLEPKAPSDNVLDDIVRSECSAGITAWSLAVAVDIRKSEDVVE